MEIIVSEKIINGKNGEFIILKGETKEMLQVGYDKKEKKEIKTKFFDVVIMNVIRDKFAQNFEKYNLSYPVKVVLGNQSVAVFENGKFKEFSKGDYYIIPKYEKKSNGENDYDKPTGYYNFVINDFKNIFKA